MGWNPPSWLTRIDEQGRRFAGVSEAEYNLIRGRYLKLRRSQIDRLLNITDRLDQHKHSILFRQPGPSADIDISLLRSWRQACSETHGDCCNDRYSNALSQHTNELQLVDVQAKCLVNLPSTTPYVALSYVWGGVSLLKAMKSNIEMLRQEGALSGNTGSVKLPDTVRDAMHLVDILGERYLWVDCLSIIQDAGDEEMNRMLKSMASIYASAELTIVVARGENANSGIRGVGGLAKGRLVGQSKAEKLLSTYGWPHESVWAERGWTYQESLFSRRLLVFDEVVSWICGRCAQHESLNDQIPQIDEPWPRQRPHLGVPMGLMSLIPKIPALGRWGMLIEEYSERTLTFQNDSVRAFAGATEAISPTFPGGIVHGVPIFFFDIAMLWQPKSTLMRRIDQPSWSWTGWKGKVACLDMWSLFHAPIFRDTGSHHEWLPMASLKPIAKYQLYTVPENAMLNMPHFNAFYAYQAIRSDPALPIPPGWTRHRDFPGAEFSFFEHSEEGEGVRYNYPLPTVATIQEGATVEPMISPFLLCTAPSVEVRFDYAMPSDDLSDYDGREDVVVSCVYNEHGTASFFNHGLAHLRGQKHIDCELLAISTADVQRPDDLIDWFEDDQLGGPTRFAENAASSGFYNVLWIERRDGVAYRKALGMISRKEWDQLGAEIVTVRLG